MPEVIGGTASSADTGVGQSVSSPLALAHCGGGELVVLVQCNRKRCGREFRLRAGQQVPASCPSCGKFDW
jgi:hypothetical protein